MQGLYLHGDFFAQTDDFLRHRTVTAVAQVFFLLPDKEVYSIKSDTTVVADNTSAAISVGKSGKNVVVPYVLHLVCISVEDTVVVRLAVLREDFVKLFGGFVAISRTGLLCHLYAAVWHEGTLQGLVGL